MYVCKYGWINGWMEVNKYVCMYNMYVYMYFMYVSMYGCMSELLSEYVGI